MGKRDGLLEQHFGFVLLTFKTLAAVPEERLSEPVSEQETDNKNTGINTNAIFLNINEFLMQ